MCCVDIVSRYGSGGRGHMIGNGQDGGHGGPRQLMDRPWEDQGHYTQDLPARRPQPPHQPPKGPMQNGTNILAAVGQQVCFPKGMTVKIQHDALTMIASTCCSCAQLELQAVRCVLIQAALVLFRHKSDWHACSQMFYFPQGLPYGY